MVKLAYDSYPSVSKFMERENCRQNLLYQVGTEDAYCILNIELCSLILMREHRYTLVLRLIVRELHQVTQH